MSSRNRVFVRKMSGSASPSSYETGSTNSTVDDLDGVSSVTERFSRAKTTNNSRYKTELCRTFAEQGRCKYGSRCQFAHGINELREIARHPRYKTELCRRFHASGFCSYGTRCHFVHDLQAGSDVSSSSESEMVVQKNCPLETLESSPESAFSAWNPPPCNQPPPGFGKVDCMANQHLQNRLDAVYLASIGRIFNQNESLGLGGAAYQCDVEAQIQLLLALQALAGTQGSIPEMNLGY